MHAVLSCALVIGVLAIQECTARPVSREITGSHSTRVASSSQYRGVQAIIVNGVRIALNDRRRLVEIIAVLGPAKLTADGEQSNYTKGACYVSAAGRDGETYLRLMAGPLSEPSDEIVGVVLERVIKGVSGCGVLPDGVALDPPLHLGMTHDQVAELFGSPSRIENDTWYFESEGETASSSKDDSVYSHTRLDFDENQVGRIEAWAGPSY